MSLLLDALKRAEEAKRAKEVVESGEAPPSKIGEGKAETSAPAELRLEDYSETIPTKSAPREPVFAEAIAPPGMTLVVEPAIEVVQDDLYQAQSMVPPPLRQGPVVSLARTAETVSAEEEGVQREAVKNAFAAKQAPRATAQGKWLLPLIAFAVVGVGAASWYVWNEINRASRPVLRSSQQPSAPLPPAASATGQIAAKPGDAAAKPIAPELPPLLPPPATEVPLPKAIAAKAAVPPEWSEREILARTLKDSPQAKESPVKLQLSRSIDPLKVNPDLMAAWQALAKAEYSQAKAMYSQLAQAEPFNLDAHLGLATAGARMGDAALAARHYRRVLEIDPRNSMAISGLLSVSGAVKIEALEVELKALIAKDAGAASLQFSLGNLYASERRWTEAQQAYFEAWRLESGNADYLYNLAVSLDQLKQTKLALEYYQKALTQAARSGGQFDRAAVQRRMAVLSGD